MKNVIIVCLNSASVYVGYIAWYCTATNFHVVFIFENVCEQGWEEFLSRPTLSCYS